MKLRVFCDVAPCSHALMMEAICTSLKRRSTSTWLHGATPQKTSLFSSLLAKKRKDGNKQHYIFTCFLSPILSEKHRCLRTGCWGKYLKPRGGKCQEIEKTAHMPTERLYQPCNGMFNIRKQHNHYKNNSRSVEQSWKHSGTARLVEYWAVNSTKYQQHDNIKSRWK
jgi:hypothetical protein